MLVKNSVGSSPICMHSLTEYLNLPTSKCCEATTSCFLRCPTVHLQTSQQTYPPIRWLLTPARTIAWNRPQCGKSSMVHHTQAPCHMACQNCRVVARNSCVLSVSLSPVAIPLAPYLAWPRVLTPVC